MSVVTSETTGRPYGVERVCTTWDVPRSTLYARQARAAAPPVPAKRRGPRPEVSDEALLGFIQADLASSPFSGEGHRKVWARLRVRDDVRVSRKRVVRIMRENHLLSPHRARRSPAGAHDGTITTSVPNDMWGTDGARVETVEQGLVWVFVAVEHWNAECVGWHVAKKGDRYAALEPVAMGLRDIYGGLGRDAARGLTVRMDNGTQYVSDHFRNQVRFWGIETSYAFVEQPQTNGVAERFIRTLKEQLLWVRTFDTVEELRQALLEFKERYNREWLCERHGHQTPAAVRARTARQRVAA